MGEAMIRYGVIIFAITCLIGCPWWWLTTLRLAKEEHRDPLLEWYWQMAIAVVVVFPVACLVALLVAIAG